MRSRSSSENINVVVVTLEKTVLVKVEGLLSRVGCDACRKRHFKAAPRFTVFPPRLDFFRHNAGPGKEKRRIQNRSIWRSSKVRQLQVVPMGVENVSFERLAGIGTFLHDLTVSRFDASDDDTNPNHEFRPCVSVTNSRLSESAFKVPVPGHSVEPTPKTWSVAGLLPCLREQFDRTNPNPDKYELPSN